ncbi:MAG: hypothetical protein AAF560_19380 [Acidobacteriota bacterium]
MDKHELLGRIRAQIEKSLGVAFIVPEDTGYFSIDDHMVGQVRELMKETIELLRDLTDYYDAESAAHGEKDETAAADGDFLREIGAQISSELAAREVSSLAFVARGQLLEMQDNLTGALENRQVWGVASYADSGLRHVGKALIAAESAVCEYEGLPASDRRWVDLADSLEIRRLYAQFRRAILRSGDPETVDQLTQHLRGASTRIAILRDLEIYPFLRIDDRRTIKQLQRRIESWLKQEQGTSEESGFRLWEDLVSFARLLIKINDREELREHDRQVVSTVHRMLFSPQRPAEQLTAGHRKELERLLGRDDELDQIILNVDEHHVEDLRGPIEKMVRQLTPSAEVPLG